jgi:hypothetical protein
MSNAPLFVTSFVGRTQERGELGRLAAKRRLVTLTEPGGVRARRGGAVLVRPDGYVAWRTREASDDMRGLLTHVLATVLEAEH